MADLTVTATQVLPGDDAVITNGRLGTTVTTGQMVYLDEDTKRYLLADANLTNRTADAVGIALNGGGLNQTVRVQTEGSVTIGAGAAPVVGTLYVVSATAGGSYFSVALFSRLSGDGSLRQNTQVRQRRTL